MKSGWLKGIPQENGLYWFEPMPARAARYKASYFILEVRNNSMWCNNWAGSGPLEAFWSKEINDFIRKKGGTGSFYCPIIPPNNDGPWEYNRELTAKRGYLWAKDKEGDVAFCLFTPDMSVNTGDLLYFDNPSKGASYSAWLRKDDGYTFQKVVMPPKLPTK